MKGDAEARFLLRRVARIEGLLHEIEASPDAAGRGAARELTGTLLDLHRAAFARVLDLLAGKGAEGRALVEACKRDAVVASALALHELAAPAPPLPKAAPPGLITLRVPREVREPSPVDRCDLCAADLSAEHRHLLALPARELACACDACATLFDGGAGRYRRVPRRVLHLDGFRMDDAQWDALSVPVHLAFFFHSSPVGRVVALYPSPAGAMESLLPLGAWDEIALLNPVLREMEPDVEALLVHRIGAAREHFLCPIDRCFELTGIFRAHRRLSPGADGQVESFLSRLKEEARCPT